MRFLTDLVFGKEEEGVMGRHAMRRSPGAWQTLRFKTTLLVILTLTSAVLGVLVGALSAQWLSPTWTIWGLGISMVGLLAATWWVWRGDLGRLRKRYSMIDLEKGIEAERRTGEVIEFALAYPNCAAAHNVSDITGTGDIDHLVVTPRAVWVVDSKFRYDGRWLDDKVDGVARQVRAVERWVVQEGFGLTPVKGCLAFLTGFDGETHEHAAKDGTPILCVDASRKDSNGLVVALHEDMKKRPAQTVDKALVRQVWELGAGDGPADQ